jgi:hypothetical protein
MSFRTSYAYLAGLATGKKHQLFVDATVVSFSLYLALKKTFGWSLTGVLLHVFQTPVIDAILWALTIVCSYAALMKAALMVVLAFPATRVRDTESENFTLCCGAMNNEIAQHLVRITSFPSTVQGGFLQNHNFERNIGLVADSLAKHMLSTLSGISKKDLFVSVYKVPNFESLDAPRESLRYVCHYPERRDAVVSTEIVFSDGVFKKYECVQCIQGTGRTRLVADCVNYYKSASKRHKKIRHYIGMRIQSGQTLLGFLNIEISNTTCFSSEDEMASYVEENVLAYGYLMEYQFLKRCFFHAVHPHLH